MGWFTRDSREVVENDDFKITIESKTNSLKDLKMSSLFYGHGGEQYMAFDRIVVEKGRVWLYYKGVRTYELSSVNSEYINPTVSIGISGIEGRVKVGDHK